MLFSFSISTLDLAVYFNLTDIADQSGDLHPGFIVLGRQYAALLFTLDVMQEKQTFWIEILASLYSQKIQFKSGAE